MDRLRKRRDFLAAAKAERAGVASILMQGRDRGDAGPVRVGFTVTKKTGNSVVRNRIRRRLREAVRRVLPEAGRPGFDYVLVAREAALRTPFDGLLAEIERAVRKLHTPRPPKGAPRAPKDMPRDTGDRRQPARPGPRTPAAAPPPSGAPHVVADDPQSRRPQGRPSEPRPLRSADPGPPIFRTSADAADGDPPA